MLNPVKTAQVAKGLPSFGATANALLNEHPENNWGIQPRSLATQIGKLDKGEVTWWINHPEVAQALGELLDLSLQDLGLHRNSEPVSGVRFSEFPGLKPLDLRREKPWQIGTAEIDEKPRNAEYGKAGLQEWLDRDPTQWRVPSDFNWLHVADGLERRLLTQYLAATSPFRVVFTRTIEAATAELQDAKPLILVLEGEVAEEDLKSLGLRNRFAGLLVIASVPRYRKARDLKYVQSFESWERLSLQDEERRQFDQATPPAFESWTWALQPDWRTALLQWVDKRLTRQGADTLFDAQSMSHWLERFDPLCQWFETTADVLQLCGIGHFESHKKLPTPNDPEAGHKLAKLMFRDNPSSRSSKIKQWAIARWNRMDLAWHGALSIDDWLSLLPPHQLPPSAEEVLKVASEKTSLERKNAANRIIEKLNAGNPEVLRESGLLREDAGGYLDFEHITLTRLVVRDKLMLLVASESPESWGKACFDADRRKLVDAALDAISVDTLMQAVQRLLIVDAGATNSAAVLGASEALFVAIGRRITNREMIPERFLSALSQLAEEVIGRLDMEWAFFYLPSPLSRSIDSIDQKLAWIGACWAWSLLIKAPNVPEGEIRSNWLFPAWSESLPPAPEWLKSLWPEADTKVLPSAWLNFFKVADEWVKDLDQPPEHIPRILKVALLTGAAQGAWDASPIWWEDLITSRSEWSEDALISRFKTTGKNGAARLWPSYLAFEMSARESSDHSKFTIFQRLYSRVRIWLLAQMSATECLIGLSRDELRHLSLAPGLLPPELRAPLLLEVGKFISFETLENPDRFIAEFGPSAVSALPQLLTHECLQAAAAKYLWAWDTANAEQILCDEGTDWQTRQSLMLACPITKIGIAAATLLKRPAIFGEVDYSYWAKSRLPNSGESAEELLEIVRRSTSG